jgi:hypothetical protein
VNELYTRIARGQKADRLAEETREHFMGLEKAYAAQWQGEEDPAKREAIWFKQRALRDVYADLIAAIGDGQLAQEELDYGRQ